MAETALKGARYAGVGYMALACMWFAIDAFLCDGLGWGGFIQVMHDGGDLRYMILVMLGLGFVTALLALGAWTFLSLPRMLKFGLLITGTAFPAYMLVSSGAGLLKMDLGASGVAGGMKQLAPSLAVAAVYMLPGLLLFRVDRLANKSVENVGHQ